MRAVVATSGALLLAAGLSACSSSSSDTLSFCTDPTYPPAEFYKVTNVGSPDLKRVLSGADIDIGKAVADKLDKDSKFVTTPFSDIIDKLLDKKCDAVISFMNDTAKRRTQVSFVDYLAAGQDLMLKKGTSPISEDLDRPLRSHRLGGQEHHRGNIPDRGEQGRAGRQADHREVLRHRERRDPRVAQRQGRGLLR